jgi:RNA polymerase sigma-70 factor, ECF subfamily
MMFFAPFRPRQTTAEPAALHARVCEGDRAALDQAYRQEAGPVYRYALALAGNPAWAADATQDAFVAYWTRPQGFDPLRGALGAYLAGIARHALLAHLREAQPAYWREAPQPADDEAEDGPGVDSPEALLLRQQDTEALWQAIRALPWPFREALVLVDLQGRAYAEAAAIAGIETNTLRTRVFRARRRLAYLLGAHE